MALKGRFPGANKLAGLVFCALLCIGFCVAVFPIDFVIGTHPYWLAQNEDITQYQAGFNAFIHEPWHWPLWRIESLNWPNGTLATFADIIPLYAAPFKIFTPMHGPTFNPYGYWVLLCLLLQGVGAWWILRESKINNWTALACLCILLLSFPAWLNRIGHISLLSQWIIVFAYALVMRNLRSQNFSYAGWTTLLLCSFLINLYLFAMAALICATQAIAYFQYKQIKRWLIWIAATAILFVAIIFVTMLPLPNQNGAIEGGYNIYSMNLMAPFSGGYFLSFPIDAYLPEQRFEGFNYLGIGVLFLLIIAIFALLKNAISAYIQSSFKFVAKLKWSLISLAIGLLITTLYSLSNQVYFGDQLIYQWQIPSPLLFITGQLRASGRFFWVVGYACVIFSVLIVAKNLPPRWASATLIFATLLQLTDLWPLLNNAGNLPTQLDKGRMPLDNHRLDSAISKDVRTLYFYPKMRCAKNSSFQQTLLPFMRYTSERSINLNTGYLARYVPPCSEEALEIAGSNPSQSVYFFVSSEYSEAQVRTLFPRTWAMQCQELDFGRLCIKKGGYTPASLIH